jgi:hypothetical protein
MTKDDIIRFAIKCKLVNTNNRDGIYMDALIDFAKLVAEKERERISQKIAQLPFGDTAQSLSIWVKNDT